jgi:hypothetical protein
MLRASLILASSLLATHIAWAGQTAAPASPAASAPAAAETESQQFARAHLMEMAKFLGSANKFSVTVRAGYDVMQSNGQTIEFGEIRDLWVLRPNQMRIEETASHGGQNLMLFDGKLITMFDGDSGAYAQAPQPGGIDDSIIYFVRDLKMRLPLAPVLMQKFPEELQQRTRSLEYVEHTAVVGQPAHHIAGRTADVDFQVWIADSKQPLPLRIVLTYPNTEGQPQFWADFSNWNLSPRFGKNTFEFKPSANAKQIIFAVQLVPPPPPPQPAGASNQGGKP